MSGSPPRQVYLVTDPHPPEENGVTIPFSHLLKACESNYPTKVIEVSCSNTNALKNPGLPPLLGKRFLTEPLEDREDVMVIGYLGTTAHLFSELRHSLKFCVVQDSLALSTSLNPRLTQGWSRYVLPTYTKWLARCERQQYSRLDGLQVTTSAEQNYLQSVGVESQIWVNRNGVRVVNGLAPSEKRFDIVALGDFRSQRNISAAQRALRLLQVLPRPSGSRHKALLVGWNASQVASATSSDYELEFRENVDDVFPHIMEAKVCVSLDPHSTGIKNSVLSAMSCGIPCFVSPEVASAFTAEDQPSFTISSSDFSAASKQLTTLLESAGLRAQLGAISRATAERYSWSKYSEQFLNMLASR